MSCRRGVGHAQTQAGQAPGFGKGLHHHQAREFGEAGNPARGLGKIGVGFIDHHQAPEIGQNGFDGFPRQQVTGGVVGRAQETPAWRCEI